MAILDNIRGLFKRGDNKVSANNNSSVRSILIKRSVYIFLIILLFAVVYFYYLNPIIIEQEQKKYRLQNWQFQISVCKDEIKSLSQEIKELELIEKNSSGLFVSNEEFESFYANIIEQTINYNLEIKDITRGEDIPVYQIQKEQNFDNFNTNFEENNIDQEGISCNDGSQYFYDPFNDMNNNDNFDPNMQVDQSECDATTGENCGNVAYYKMLVDYEITGSFQDYLKFRNILSNQPKIVNIENETISTSENSKGKIIAKAQVSLVRN